MPTYTYRCPECEHRFEEILRMSQSDEPQTCRECGHAPAQKTITGVNFILSGDSWPGKQDRIRNQMQKKRERLFVKEEERKREAPVGGKLVPNVGGERVDNWAEASKLAASKGLDSTGYEKKAVVEQSLTKKIVRE